MSEYDVLTARVIARTSFDIFSHRFVPSAEGILMSLLKFLEDVLLESN